MAIIIGSQGNDWLISVNEGDVLYGNGGDDFLGGNDVGYNDTFYGGTGNDTLSSADAAAALYGGDGNDYIQVQYSSEVISGGTGDDTLSALGNFSGTDISGIEQLNPVSAILSLAQLSSFQRIGAAAPGVSAEVRLSQGGTATLNVLNTVGRFTLTGSSQAENITINPSFAQGVSASLSHGHDIFQSSVGNDSLYGEAGNDTLYGGDGNDLLDGGYGANSLSGGFGNDTLIAGGLDTVDAGDGDDVVFVISDHPVSLDGGVGQDTLSFRGYFDLSGATIAGFETLALSPNAGNAAMVSATQLALFSTVAGQDASQTSATLKLISGGTADVAVSRILRELFVTGSEQNDTLTFRPQLSTTNLSIHGAGGSDSILAGSGADYLSGGTGNDTLTAGGGADTLHGGSGVDLLLGEGGNDRISCGEFDEAYGGGGSDLFETLGGRMAIVSGGDGLDSLRVAAVDLTDTQILSVEKLIVASGPVSLTAAQLGLFKQVTADASGIRVYLTAPGTAAVKVAPEITDAFSVIGSSGGDRLTINADYLGRVEFQGREGNDSIVAANGNDELYGDTGRDTVVGMTGNDTLYGGYGNDRLIGGRGADLLSGDYGSDVFVFLVESDSTASGQDTIYGFEGAGPLAQDLIDLSAIDADVTTAADDAFTFNSVQKGGLYIVDNLDGTLEIRLNTDADATPEMRITISGLTFGSASLFTATDFIL